MPSNTPNKPPKRPKSGPLAPMGPAVAPKGQEGPRNVPKRLKATPLEPQEIEGGAAAAEAWELLRNSSPAPLPGPRTPPKQKRSGPLPRKPVEVGPPWGLFYRHRVLPAKGAAGRKRIGDATAKRIVDSLNRPVPKASKHDEFHEAKTIALARKRLPVG